MTLIATRATGATTMPLGMTVAEPECEVTPAQLSAQQTGPCADNAFLAGTLSAFLAHERAGACLYRVASDLAQDPRLIEKFEEFGRETEEHIAIYEELISALGGDPTYVSPTARMTEAVGTKLLEAPVLLCGSVDQLTLDATLLEAVGLAEYRCHGNWQFVARLAESLGGPAGEAIAAAVAKVGPQEDEHLTWATATWMELATQLCDAGTGSVAGTATETKAELLERAREAGIEGRSSMTKAQLQEALDGR